MPDEKAVDRLLNAVLEKDVSDIHFKVGSIPIIRKAGMIIHVAEFKPMKTEHVQKIVDELVSEYQAERLARGEEVDLGYSLPGKARFRVNIYNQRGTPAVVMRRIPYEIPDIDELGLPEVVKKIAMEPRGLVLVTGVTGSGKSTSIAAMINYINQNRSVHIVTIEDPIEFLHRDINSTICQREVGIDTQSWSSGLRAVFRQDPDVILIGEMRDPETIATALTGAETGHLVLSTLHTTDTMETISRIIDVFPSSQQHLVRLQLGQLISGIISQRLLPGKQNDEDEEGENTSRVLAAEVLVRSSTVTECIIHPDKTYLLTETIEKSFSQYGMQTFDMALYQLIVNDKIDKETALASASNPTKLDLRLKGIETASDWKME
ncbi:MAG: PilT/PilU family type 4a pilus ATPase [Candidatus Aegiribacteria sp.]|nr:PilT/PilU family type 4a pilus ATPase [Candidatus Aegiribacteria sp.]